MKTAVVLLMVCILQMGLQLNFVTPVTGQVNPSTQFVLHDGTPLRLRLGRTISSASAKVGETVDFELLEDVQVADTVVIERGAIALATVTEAQPKRRMGRGGKLNVNIDHIRLVTGEKVALRAVKDVSGGGRTGVMTGAIVASAIVFFPAAPFFLFMKGKDITIPKGTEISAYVNGEIQLKRQHFNSDNAADNANPKTPDVGERDSQLVQAEVPPLGEVVGTTSTSAVTFQSTPNSADIEINGRFAGNTPTLLQLKVGEHKITVKSKGYLDWHRTISVEAGGSVNVIARLEKSSTPPSNDALKASDSPNNDTEDKGVVPGSVVLKPGGVPASSSWIDMVWIPPGEFMMGALDGKTDEKRVRKVAITNGFWMGRHEVTQLQWFSEMGSNPSYFDKCGGDCPVENVSWDDAKRFIERLNAKNDGFVYSLPTEAEWEYAARAGTTGRFAADVDSMGWHRRNSNGTTRPVGTRQPNPWGLYDMHGNVWEWCEDWYGDYQGMSLADPAGPASGKSRVLRGGAWNENAADLRSSFRGKWEPSTRFRAFGFRVVARPK